MKNIAVGAIIDHRYDLLLVALSVTISVLGSYVALTLASAKGPGRDRVVGPAVALGGCAIWAMHFIGMAAYQTPIFVSYAVFPTIASLLIAIFITGLGFKLAAAGQDNIGDLLIGGGVIGAGVVAMHYLGIFGMEMSASIDWDVPRVVASVVIAVMAATAALWLAFNVRTTAQRLGAAVIMGIAVCAMHYTAMAAATLVCVANVIHSGYSVDGDYLAFLIFGVALLALGWSSFYSRIGTLGSSGAA